LAIPAPFQAFAIGSQFQEFRMFRFNWLRLKRHTSSGDYLPALDGLRWLAVIVVVFGHQRGNWLNYQSQGFHEDMQFAYTSLDWWVDQLANFAGMGVRLFFVISGYILARGFLKRLAEGKGPGLKNYYLRRITRIEPLYFISMIVLYIGLCLTGKGDWWEQLPHLLASLCYMHNIIYGDSSTILTQAWTLELEVQWYLLAPLTYPFLKLRALPRILIYGALMMFHAVVDKTPLGQIPALPLFIGYFVGGVMVADVSRFIPGSQRTGHISDVIGAASVAAFLIFTYQLAWLGNARILTPLVLSLFVFGVLNGRLLAKIFAWSWIAIPGGMCYSIYIWHGRAQTLPLILGVKDWTLEHGYAWDYLLMTLVLMPCVALVSLMAYVFVERPTMDPAWPQKLKAWLTRRTNRKGAVPDGDGMTPRS